MRESALFTKQEKSFARRSRASTLRGRVKPLKIRQTLTETLHLQALQSALEGQDASREASTLAIHERILARFACKLVSIRRTEIDLLTLDSGIGLLLDVEHRLGAAIGH